MGARGQKRRYSSRLSLVHPLPRRVVLDTNVVLDLAVFHEPSCAWLLQQIDSGEVLALTNRACWSELERVVAYPQFKLDTAAQRTVMQWCAARLQRIDEHTTNSAACPLRCHADPDDQKFLDLAWMSDANFLLTHDLALLKLASAARRTGRFEILPPAQALLHRAFTATPS